MAKSMLQKKTPCEPAIWIIEKYLVGKSNHQIGPLHILYPFLTHFPFST